MLHNLKSNKENKLAHTPTLSDVGLEGVFQMLCFVNG